jgi:STE24 endopeptidase
MNALGYVVLAALLADFSLRRLAEALNLQASRAELPAAFRDVYDPGRYGRARDYLRARTRFGWLSAAFFMALTLAFWFGGGFGVLDGWVRAAGMGSVASGLLYIGAILLARAALAVPFQAYAVFVIEERFGFNRTRFKTFVADGLKGLLLALVLGGPLLAAVLLLFEHAGQFAWAACWALAALFALGMQIIAPRWILPLFNTFSPLEEGPLRAAIFDYARSIRFPLENVFVMDGSRRSTKSNAFFTGFGRHRRIALFDTLIRAHTIPELVAVLAHETGHYRKRHVLKGLALGLLHTGVLLFGFSLAARSPALFEAFYVAQPSVYAGLVIFALVLQPLELLLGALVNRVSRAHERAADRFAVETTGDRKALAAALKKLSTDNLSTLSPHPLYVALNYSHPPIQERIRAIERRP